MSETSTVIQLFRKWRSGDEASGQEMAQRFSDWYYAISTIRIPGTAGRPPMEAACQSFAQGIVTVTRPRALVDWAHDLLERELSAAGYGLNEQVQTGSDNPNAMTRNRSPRELLQSVAGSVDPALLQILALAYNQSTPLAVVDRAAEPLGGTPYALLKARYQIKRALRAGHDVPFAVAPEDMDMDRAPISLYEAHRLASGKEMAELEKWLLSDIDLCKDIAEFSAFVHALRGGAFAEFAVEPETPAEPIAVETESPTDTEGSVGIESDPPAAPHVEPATPSEIAPSAVPTSANEGSPPPNNADLETDPPEVAAEPPAPRPSPSPSAPPAAKGSTFRATLITLATVIAMIVLIGMIFVFILRG